MCDVVLDEAVFVVQSAASSDGRSCNPEVSIERSEEPQTTNPSAQQAFECPPWRCG